MAWQEVENETFPQYKVVMGVSKQDGQPFCFLKNESAKPEMRNKTTLEAMIRRHGDNNARMLTDWYITTRARLLGTGESNKPTPVPVRRRPAPQVEAPDDFAQHYVPEGDSNIPKGYPDRKQQTKPDLAGEWRTALEVARETGMNIKVWCDYGKGQRVPCFLRGMQGNTALLTSLHTTKMKASDGSLSSQVFKANISDISER